MTTKILAGIAIFVILNLLITVCLRYLSANDGWLQYYRRKVVDKGP
jgi:hypothetical protein